MIWFTADTHFGHANIIKHCNRPFSSAEEMDNVLLDNINQQVKKNDVLYHLGDWSWFNARRYRDAIKCDNVYLIFGNHDKKRIRKDKATLNSQFRWSGDFLEIQVGDQHITLCHYALRVWNQSHRGAWHLYGHSHGSLPDDPGLLSFDVGVDCTGFRPLSFDEVKERMSVKNFVPIDHHVNTY